MKHQTTVYVHKSTMPVLREIAARGRYMIRRGPGAGLGSVSEMLDAIADGEGAVLFLTDGPREALIDFALEQSSIAPDPTLQEALRALHACLVEAQQLAASATDDS